MGAPLWVWVLFNVGVLAVLAVDLGLARAHRPAPGAPPRTPTTAEALRWVLVWIALSAAIGAALWLVRGPETGLEFFTAWIVEYALSVDNLFVFLLVFQYFRIDDERRHLLLFWGVLGAFVLRGVLILGGAALVQRFEWLLYVLGAFLVFTAVKLARSGGESETADPEHNGVLRLARRVLPIAEDAPPDRFLVRTARGLRVTPLFLVLLVIETTDLVFAVDSIPAIFGVSRDPFVLYTSNVCAVLGLRSLFFVVAALLGRLHYLEPALAVVLGFVGLKMLLAPWIDVPTGVSLGIIAFVLGTATLASWRRSAGTGDAAGRREDGPPPPG